MEQQLGTLLTNFTIPSAPVTEHKTYRAEQIEEFMKFLRGPYKAYKGKELEAKRVALALNKARVKDWELKPFRDQCLASKNPSAHFWSSFKDGHWERQAEFRKKFMLK